jgi:GTP-binding protein HflX
LDELEILAHAAGAEIILRVLQQRETIDSRYYIGKGKIEEIAFFCQSSNVNLVVFDDPLAPAQLRNIETALQQKVIDRNQLIMDIFARRARSKEGRLQVELAQLNYLLPRLKGRGVDLSQLGAGIGTRGPGETKLETDRRKIFRRINSIKEQINKISHRRSIQRKKRKSSHIPIISLVGYTNAGKSTLFNYLTSANVEASSKPFQTLDPIIRRLELDDNEPILVSDTVGFIRKIPPELLAAFKSTLEEVMEADIILNVIDISASNFLKQRETVESILNQMGVGDVPIINVLNKVDLIPVERLAAIKNSFNNSVLISALTGYGVGLLIEKIVFILSLGKMKIRFRIPCKNGRIISLLYSQAKILNRRLQDGNIIIEAEINPNLVERYKEYMVNSK